MSRIAKMPVTIPNGVEIKLTTTEITVKGPKGELNRQVNPLVKIDQTKLEGSEANVLTFSAKGNSKSAKANSGTIRALVNNMVTGVTDGFDIKLELVGVGYRANVQGKKVGLTLGFSHPVDYQLPEGIVAETPTQTEIIIKGIDKQKVGQVAAEIRAIRPPENYKGKGVRYSGEYIIRKEAKKK